MSKNSCLLQIYGKMHSNGKIFREFYALNGDALRLTSNRLNKGYILSHNKDI